MTALPAELFTAPLPGLRRPLTQPEGRSLRKYLELLVKWQSTHRLVGSVKASWLIENVVLDSLTFLELLPAEALEVADVGSGAGIPGVPIAIVRPDLALTLIEGRRRRVSFLSTVIRELGLSRTTVVEARVEDLAGSHRDRFDAIVMRCAGSPEALLPPARTLLRSGGAIIMSARRGREVDGAETIAIRTKAGHARLLHRFLKP